MRKYLAQSIVFSVYALFSVSWFVVSVLSTEIMQELSISAQETVLISNSIVFAKIFGSLFAGFLFYKFGLRVGYFLGCLFISANILANMASEISFIKPFYLIIFSRFLSGLGSAVALAALVPIANKYFEKSKHLSLVITINMNSNLAGSLIAFIFYSQIVQFFDGWRSALGFFGYANFILIILWLFIDVKDENKATTQQKSQINILKNVFKSKILWAMIIYYISPLLFLNSTGLHITMYIKYELVKANVFSIEKANDIAKIFLSIITIISIITPFLGTYLKNKGFKKEKILTFVSFVLALCVGMYYLKTEYAFYLIALLGGGVFGMLVPYLFSIPVEYCKKDFASYVVSIFWSISFLILFINNQLIAYIYDLTHTYKYAFIYMILLLLISPIGLNLLKGEKNETK